MKTWMKVVLGIFAGIAVLVGFVFWLTGDVTKAGDDFFAAVQNDDIDAAYELLSDDFKAGTSKEELVSYLSANALDKVGDVSWGSRKIESNRGTLDGTVETENGNSIPLTLRLVNGSNGWRIQSIRKEEAGFQSATADNPVPSKTKQLELVRRTMSAFEQSLADGNMSKLYSYSSQRWQQAASIKDFEGYYGSIYEFKDLFAKVSQFNPALEDAIVNEETGALSIKSYYRTTPSRLFFDTIYVYEGTDWKLAGLSVELGQRSE